MKRKILLLFLFLLVRASYAQQPITIQLTEKDKLPDNKHNEVDFKIKPKVKIEKS